jgi:peptidyl-tRNA hydrolase
MNECATPPSPDRFYIAVRADLTPGLQLAQAVHAMAQFAHDHPNEFTPWQTRSNYLVVVAVDNEDELLELIVTISRKGLQRSAVREPDIGNQVTAVAIEPGADAKRICAQYPLALKVKVKEDLTLVWL